MPHHNHAAPQATAAVALSVLLLGGCTGAPHNNQPQPPTHQEQTATSTQQEQTPTTDPTTTEEQQLPPGYIIELTAPDALTTEEIRKIAEDAGVQVEYLHPNAFGDVVIGVEPTTGQQQHQALVQALEGTADVVAVVPEQWHEVYNK